MLDTSGTHLVVRPQPGFGGVSFAQILAPNLAGERTGVF